MTNQSMLEQIPTILDLADLPDHPVELFSIWFELAKKFKIPQFNSMALATSGRHNKPSVRMVLLKDYSQKGLVFFTNYISRKSQELYMNSHAATVFYWHEIDRQIRVEGVVQKLPSDKSEAYFYSRDQASQLGAWASKQSSVVENSKQVAIRFQKYKQRFQSTGKIPYPEFWGGYIIIPNYYEFWVNQPHRLHDRYQYRLLNDTWQKQLLAP